MKDKEKLANEILKKACEILAKEFGIKEEFIDYVREHPGINRSNHTIKKKHKPGMMKKIFGAGKVHFTGDTTDPALKFQVIDNPSYKGQKNYDKFFMQIVKGKKVMKELGTHPSANGAKKFYENRVKDAENPLKGVKNYYAKEILADDNQGFLDVIAYEKNLISIIKKINSKGELAENDFKNIKKQLEDVLKESDEALKNTNEALSTQVKNAQVVLKTLIKIMDAHYVKAAKQYENNHTKYHKLLDLNPKKISVFSSWKSIRGMDKTFTNLVDNAKKIKYILNKYKDEDYGHSYITGRMGRNNYSKMFDVMERYEQNAEFAVSGQYFMTKKDAALIEDQVKMIKQLKQDVIKAIPIAKEVRNNQKILRQANHSITEILEELLILS